MKMKKMIYLMLALMVISVASVKAQVRIGDSNDPTPGAVLDLNATNYKGGLLLPKVNLTTLTAVSDLTNPAAAVADLRGLIVYNLNSPAVGIAEGVYVWNGTNKWEAIWIKN